MDVILALIVGLLYAVSLFMILRKGLIRIIIGIIILGHASNLFLFVISRLTRGNPPIVPHGMEMVTEPFADPLPQALILTAIVIGFGIQAFGIVLLQRAYRVTGASVVDDLNTTDKIDKKD